MAKEQGFYLIIVAAGSGSRFGGDTPKQYLPLGGKTVLRHSVDAFASLPSCLKIAVVIDPSYRETAQCALTGLDDIILCEGGKTRQESVANGLSCFDGLVGDDTILIHDSARPFVERDAILRLLGIMQEAQAATLACPISDTLRYADENGGATEGVDRENLWSIQTPQAFKYDLISRAHAQAQSYAHTDDTALASALGADVKFVASSARNFKITQSKDWDMAQQMLPYETRVGMGYDVHAFDNDVTGVEAIRLCGVDVPFDRKLKGHSDADVGLHTITDAILGAIGEGDIGLHFPPSNNDFKDMDSAVFLEHAMKLLRDKGGKLVNIDLTLICERPKLGAHRDIMRQRVADILDVAVSRVNIKATTTEKLGFTGRKEGIAAQAVASVMMPQEDE